jgi:hypothetical protein
MQAGAVPEQSEYRILFCFVPADPRQGKFFWYIVVLFQHSSRLLASVLLTGETGSKRNRHPRRR